MNFDKTLFKTNDFAKLCGINKKTLLYYDEIDLLTPVYKNSKGYRYYSHQQYDQFTLISILKDINMPLADIKNFITNRSPENSLNTLINQKEILDKRIEKLKHTSSVMNSLIDKTKNSLNLDYNSIYFETITSNEFLTLSLPLSIDSIEDNNKFVKALSEHIHYCDNHNIHSGNQSGAVLSKEDLLSHNFINIKYLFSKSNYNPNTERTILKPKGLYVVGFHIGDYFDTPATYMNLLKYIKDNNLKIIGDCYEESLLDFLTNDNSSDFITKISINVSKIS